jgi:RNA polymerase sigma-70 factor (ECF subfamily)
VRTDKPRFEADAKEREKLIRKFSVASTAGDEKTLLALFADEISMTSDGGGKVTAARKIVQGSRKLARALMMFGTKYGAFLKDVPYQINGEPGLLTFHEGVIFCATTFEFTDGKISGVYRVMNPDKLKVCAGVDERNLAL